MKHFLKTSPVRIRFSEKWNDVVKKLSVHKNQRLSDFKIHLHWWKFIRLHLSILITKKDDTKIKTNFLDESNDYKICNVSKEYLQELNFQWNWKINRKWHCGRKKTMMKKIWKKKLKVKSKQFRFIWKDTFANVNNLIGCWLLYSNQINSFIWKTNCFLKFHSSGKN